MSSCSGFRRTRFADVLAPIIVLRIGGLLR
jgi:hypothetical protein